MRRFAGAVIAADHHPPVEGKTGEDRERRVMVEAVGVIVIGHVLARLAECRHFEIGIDAERLTHRYLDVRLAERCRSGCRLLNGWHCLWYFLVLLGRMGGDPAVVQLK